MSNVIPLLGPFAFQAPSAHERYTRARADFLRAYHSMLRAQVDWLATDPPVEDVQTELEGTANTLEQIAQIVALDAPLFPREGV